MSVVYLARAFPLLRVLALLISIGILSASARVLPNTDGQHESSSVAEPHGFVKTSLVTDPIAAAHDERSSKAVPPPLHTRHMRGSVAHIQHEQHERAAWQKGADALVHKERRGGDSSVGDQPLEVRQHHTASSRQEHGVHGPHDGGQNPGSGGVVGGFADQNQGLGQQISASDLCDVLNLADAAMQALGPDSIDAADAVVADVVKNLPWAASSPETVQTIVADMLMGRWYEVYTNTFVQSTARSGAVCVALDLVMTSASPTSASSAATPLTLSATEYWGIKGPMDIVPSPSLVRGTRSAQFVTPGKLMIQVDPLQPDNCTSDALWILMLGPQDATGRYAYAVISDPFLITLSVIARNVALFQQYFASDMVSALNGMGFRYALNSPVLVDQDSCTYPPELYAPTTAEDIQLQQHGGADGSMITTTIYPTSTTADPLYTAASVQPTTVASMDLNAATSNPTATSAAVATESSGTDRTGLRIALSVVGGLVLGCILAIMAILLYRRRRLARPVQQYQVDDHSIAYMGRGVDQKGCDFCDSPSCHFYSAEDHIIGAAAGPLQEKHATAEV